MRKVVAIGCVGLGLLSPVLSYADSAAVPSGIPILLQVAKTASEDDKNKNAQNNNQTPTPRVTGGSEDVVTAVRNLTAGYGDEQTDALYALPWDAANTQEAQQSQLVVAQYSDWLGNQSSFDVTKNFLLAPPPSLKEAAKQKSKSDSKSKSKDTKQTPEEISQQAEAQAKALGPTGLSAAIINIPGSDFMTQAQLQPTMMIPILAPQDRDFDFSSIVGTLQFQPETGDPMIDAKMLTKTSAQNFVKVASRIGGSASLVPQIQPDSKGSTVANSIKAYQDPNFQYYLANYRGYAAALSIAVNNLNMMVSERAIVPGLAQEAKNVLGHDSASFTNMSPLALSYLMATKRLTSAYQQKMVQATPATLMREQVNLLAEINYRMYQQHQDNERILAALSMLIVQGAVNYRDTQLVNALGALPKDEGGAGGGSSVSNPATQAATGKANQPFPTKAAGSGK